MARWRLTAKHYLNVPGTEWEQSETDIQTQKPVRKRYAVPLFLNPDDASDCNYPGEIIVSNGNNPQSRDIIFSGPPTPDMDPLDDEAAEISAQLRPTWSHPIEGLEGYGGAVLNDLQRQIIDVQSKMIPTPVSASGISKKDFEELRQTVLALSQQNEALTAELDAMREASE